jgi:hypothetical protein
LNLSEEIERTNRVIVEIQKNKSERTELFKLEDQCAGFYVTKMDFDKFKSKLGGSTEEQQAYVEQIKEKHEESVKNHNIYM